MQIEAPPLLTKDSHLLATADVERTLERLHRTSGSESVFVHAERHSSHQVNMVFQEIVYIVNARTCERFIQPSWRRRTCLPHA